MGTARVPPGPVAVSAGREGMQLRLAVGAMGSSSQRADHFPGLLQPTGVDANMRAEEKGLLPRFRKGQSLVLLVPDIPSRVPCVPQTASLK